MPKALFISSNYWTSPYRVGTHHLAKGLAEKGWEILFISEPVSWLHKIKNNPDIEARFYIYRTGGSKRVGDGIQHYVPYTFTPYYNRFPLNAKYFVGNWYKFTYPSILKYVHSKKFSDVDLLYFDTVRQPFWLDKIKYTKSVFRIPDYIGGYSSYSKALNECENFLIRNVDLVLCTAKTLIEKINRIRSSGVAFLPNGVDFELFNNYPGEIPPDLINIERPRIIYIGETEKRFDHNLLLTVAKKLNKHSFVVIGHKPGNIDEYDSYNNVFFLGKKNYNDLPAYLKYCDAGIIPYDIRNKRNLIDYINPLKMYQYFAAGLPTFTPSWKELELINPPVIKYKSDDELCELLTATKFEDIDKNSLINFAKNFEWKNIIEQFMELIAK